MQIITRVPDNFRCYPELVVTDFNGRINYKVAEYIKLRALFSEFAAWGLTGKIWWDKKENIWCTEIWKKSLYITSLCGETIEDLLFSIQKYCARKY